MDRNYLSERIINTLSIARLAPSVHNTQPWRVSLQKDKLLIHLAEDRRLMHGDPTGRQSFISLGIFAEACALGLAMNGISVSGTRLKDGLVEISTSLTDQPPSTEHMAMLEALQKRSTDRSIYKHQALSASQKDRIESAWASDDVVIAINDRPEVIEKCAGLTKQALLLAMSSPDFRKELAKHLVRNHKVPYGIPLSTLGTSAARKIFVRQVISTGLNRKSDALAEYRRWLSASGLVFVLAEGDSPRYWVDSGRAYLGASLAIQRQGLSQATSAAIVEAADFHEDIEKMLGTEKRIQCLLRIGKGQAKKPRSGRLSPESLLIT